MYLVLKSEVYVHVDKCKMNRVIDDHFIAGIKLQCNYFSDILTFLTKKLCRNSFVV